MLKGQKALVCAGNFGSKLAVTGWLSAGAKREQRSLTSGLGGRRRLSDLTSPPQMSLITRWRGLWCLAGGVIVRLNPSPFVLAGDKQHV